MPYSLPSWPLVAVVLALTARAALAADPDAAGAEVLARVDRIAERADDATIVMDVTVHDGRGGEASRVLTIWQKGDDRRLIKFLEPARLAGVGLLLDETDTLHLYLPAYGRSRRVVGSGRGDAFMGTDFSMDDLARITFGDEYTASLTGEDDAHWTLRLDPKVPADHAHHHLTMRVRKADDLFDQVEFVDEDNTITRRIAMDDVRPAGAPQHPVAHGIEVADLDSGRRTVARIRTIEFDTGLADDLFTTRYLMRD